VQQLTRMRTVDGAHFGCHTTGIVITCIVCLHLPWLTTISSLCRPSSPLPRAAATAAGANELQKYLLATEEQLTLCEEGLETREVVIEASERAIGEAHMVLDNEQAQVEASRQCYLNKLRAHMTCMKHTLGLDKVLKESMVLLKEKKRDLKVQEATLCKALERGIHPQDNQDLLAQLVEPREHLAEVEVDCTGEVKELVSLVTTMFRVLVDLGLDSIQWIT
jgi:hypothetical protein